jgi:predicted nucleotidyltransferase
MTTMLMIRRPQLVYRVLRLNVFGSAAQDDSEEESSDVDLLVEFDDDMPYADRADAYLGFLTEAEALLGRHVDLVEVGAVRNPYLRDGIEASRRLLFAERSAG